MISLFNWIKWIVCKRIFYLINLYVVKKIVWWIMENKKESRRLKIGLFVDNFFPMIDGVVMVVDNYARRLCENHDVTVFTCNPSKKGFDDKTLPYKVVRCPKMKLIGMDYVMPLPRFSKKFKKQVENGNFDLIHIHSPFGVGNCGVRYAKKHSIPLVATLHSQYYKDFLRETHSKKLAKFLLKKIIKVFNRCDEFWAVNSNVAKIYFEEYGLRALPKVHNNGTDLKFIENFDKKELMKKYEISKDEKVFLFVGRITYLKNVDFIVRSLAKLKETGFKFKMLFVGSGPDQDKLKQLIESLGLDENILLLGKITDRLELSKIYALADLFLFPSLYDCSSLVQIEAASQKTPTVFIKDSATACAINDNVNGYLAEISEDDYANKIMEIFKSEEEYEKVSKQAFEQLYITWDQAVEKALADYLTLINK